ncbi:MAG: dihydroneopterin aldolase [Acidimicrobiales bacterium]
MLEQEGGRSGSGERGARRPDRILLEGLRFLGTHGALPEEAERPQPFEVDLELLLDLRPAGRSDDIAATVDYAGLCEAARAVVEGPSVLLVERLAQLVAERALAVAGDRAEGVVVTVRKLRPPVPVELAAAGVRVYRP